MATPSPLAFAVAVEQRVRACPGVAGLDPASRLVTVGPDRAIRGVHLASGAPEAPGGVVRVDLVGLAGARLPEAAEAARGAILAEAATAGLAGVRVELRVSDVAESVLPLQTRATTARATPLDAGVGRPPPGDDATPRPGREPRSPPTRVRVRVPGPDGRELSLLITVEVEDA